MTTLQSDLLVDARASAIRELEIARKQGVRAAQDLLAVLTPDNFDELWPLIAPLVSETLQMQQESGRRAMKAYMGAAALAAGFPLYKMMLPSNTNTRNGRLPSGMPWGRLIGSAPLAVKHRIDNGMSAVEAVRRTQSQMFTVINSQAFSDFRDTAFDFTVNGPQPPEGMFEIKEKQSEYFERLDREYNERVAELRGKKQVVDGVDLSALTMRYFRQPEANACPFCMLLATNGAVYYGADTKRQSLFGRQVGFRGTRRFGGNRPYEWKAHNNCRCSMFPVFSGTAMKGIVGVDDTYFNNKNSVWRDPRSGREYDLRRILSLKENIKDQIGKKDLVNA